MTTMNLALYYQTHKAEDLPAHPVARIYVKSAVGHNYRDAQGRMFICSPCASVTELEHEVKRLHKELDEILLTARKTFAKAAAA